MLLKSGHIEYDTLVVAAGARHSYFGHDEWEPLAPGLKTIEDATEIRRRVLMAFEAAEVEDDPERRAAWLTFVIVGGGPTGVELAGSLAELAGHTLSHDFLTWNRSTHLITGSGQALSNPVSIDGDDLSRDTDNRPATRYSRTCFTSL